jgi:hypothetical protein
MSAVKIDMPVDSARKLARHLYQTSTGNEWDELAAAIVEAARAAGDGVTISVDYQ